MNENEEKTTQQESQTVMSPDEVAERIGKGTLKLKKPIMDGETSYDELKYDFNALTGWELSRALDSATGRSSSTGTLTNVQALGLFAAAAAKRTGGLDAHDIMERISSGDAIAAINVASLFFKGSILAGGARTSNE